jgi:hypothetical protein
MAPAGAARRRNWQKPGAAAGTCKAGAGDAGPEEKGTGPEARFPSGSTGGERQFLRLSNKIRCSLAFCPLFCRMRDHFRQGNPKRPGLIEPDEPRLLSSFAMPPSNRRAIGRARTGPRLWPKGRGMRTHRTGNDSRLGPVNALLEEAIGRHPCAVVFYNLPSPGGCYAPCQRSNTHDGLGIRCAVVQRCVGQMWCNRSASLTREFSIANDTKLKTCFLN